MTIDPQLWLPPIGIAVIQYLLMAHLVYSIIRHRYRRIQTKGGIIIITQWGDRILDLWMSATWPITLFTLLPTWAFNSINRDQDHHGSRTSMEVQ
jgi:hypothetical protein